ncbi:MAG: tetratricopeptide repeat protein [Acidobacteriota bacterium]|nr:tetratricopeptide repeat protein [Acidobacteriota bacterium]
MAADNKKKKLLAGAEKYALQGKLRQAIAEYLKAVEIDPEDSTILNTIGDLYLRQNDVASANRYFKQVAEKYAETGYFLKAVAIYKKILNSSPDDCQLISTVAALYARQGLAMEACAQYTRVIGLLERTERGQEAKAFYEKIAELDPSNVDVRRKLAAWYRDEGDLGRAQACWGGAARAEAKAGNFAAAIGSWRNAMEAAPLDVGMLQEFADCCLKGGDPAAVLEPLQKAVNANPENLDLKELLGRVFLATGDFDEALATAQSVFKATRSRYEGFFEAGRALLDKEAYDQASGCLDAVVPTLLSRLEPGRAVEFYQAILERDPRHELTLIKLASVYSATGDQAGYLGALHTLADGYMESERHIEALEHIEKILQADPGDDRYCQLHRDVFAKAYPGMAYTPPAMRQETQSLGEIVQNCQNAEGADACENIREADTLLNYGLLDRALNVLRRLEARDPYDKEVHRRLLSVYKAIQNNDEAAKQCLLLAFLYRTETNEVLSKNFQIEAGQLAPDLVANVDLEQLVQERGIRVRGDEAPDKDELDLSPDLLDTLFEDAAKSVGLKADDAPEALDIPEAGMDAAGRHADGPAAPGRTALELHDVPSPERPPEARLQEIDVYINLGFNDEARAKLDELARTAPGHPEILARRQRLAQAGSASPVSIPAAPQAPQVTADDSIEAQMAAAQSKRDQDFALGTFLDEHTDQLVVQREEKEMGGAAATPVAMAPVATPAPAPPAVQAAPPAATAPPKPAAAIAPPMPAPPAPALPGIALLNIATPAATPVAMAPVATPAPAPPAVQAAPPAATAPPKPAAAIAPPMPAPPAPAIPGIALLNIATPAATPVAVAPVATPAPAPPAVQAAPPAIPGEPPSKVNGMFADLFDEVSAPADPAVEKASFEDHFNMGIAFSEMELYDEAVKEFEAAVRHLELRRGDLRVLQCCERLSHCYLRKNMPTSALRWCQTGLNLTEKSSHEDMAFRYDMGVAHALAGDADQALVCFDQVFRRDPGYRDVAQRIDELKGGLQKHAV